MSWRETIEGGVVTAITTADTTGLFSTVKAVGQLEESDFEETGLVKVPFAVVRLAGATATDAGGSLIEATASVEILVASSGNYGGADARKTSCLVLLEVVFGALKRKLLSATGIHFHPLTWAGEEGAGVDDETGCEVWRQRWTVDFAVEG